MGKGFQISVCLLVFMASAFATIAGIFMSAASPAFALLPVLIFLAFVGMYGVVAAAEGARWAIALFVPFAILVISSTVRVESSGVGYDFQSVTKFATFCIAFLIGGLGLRYAYPKLLTPTGLFVALYAIWAAVSSVYSPIPDYTLAASFGIMAWVVLAATVCARFTPREVLLILLTAFSLFILISWPVYLFMPSLGTMHFGSPDGGITRFTGIGGTPNGASQLAVAYMATFAAFYLSRFRFNARYRLPLTLYFGGTAVLAFGILLLSDSRGSLLAFVAVCLSILVQRTRSAPYAILAALIFLFVLFAVPDPLSLVDGVLVLLSRSGDVQELFTLTGRVDIWSAVIDRIQQSPLIGTGYAASRVVIPEIWANRWGQSVGSAHNFVLQSLLEVGTIGTALLLLAFVTCAVRYFARPDYFRDSIFLIALMTGLVESGVSASTNVLILVWFISMFYDSPTEARLPYDARGDISAGHRYVPRTITSSY